MGRNNYEPPESALMNSDGARIRGTEGAGLIGSTIGSEILWNGEWDKISASNGYIAGFSFHSRVVIRPSDGGILGTLNAKWDAQFGLRRHHTMRMSTTARQGTAQLIFESYPTLGYDYRMTDIQAAIGHEQRKRQPGIIANRRYLAGRYRTLLGDVEGPSLPKEPRWTRMNWRSYCVRLPENGDQRIVMQPMLHDAIGTRRGVKFTHRASSSAKRLRWNQLVHSEEAQEHCVLLPLFTQMTEAERRQVAEALRKVVRNRNVLGAALKVRRRYG